MHRVWRQPCSSKAPAIVSRTASPTSGTSVVTPNALRPITPVASKPTVYLLSSGFTPAPTKRAVSISGFETPCRVRMPAIVAVPLPVGVTTVETKVAVGWAAASNQAALFSSPSSLGLVVATEAIGIVTSSLTAARLAGSIRRVPDTSENVPE